MTFLQCVKERRGKKFKEYLENDEVEWKQHDRNRNNNNNSNMAQRRGRLCCVYEGT